MITRITKNLVVFIAIACSLFRVHKNTSDTYQRFIIFYPTGNIGDMVCATPLFDAIKKQNSHAHITAVTSQINIDLLEGHPSVDDCLLFKKGSWSLIKKVKEANYDAGIAINMDAYSIAVMMLGGVFKVVSFDLSGKYRSTLALPFKIVSRYIHTVSYTPGTYIPETLLNLLKPFDIEAVEGGKTLAVSVSDREAVDELLSESEVGQDEKVVVIAPGAGSDLKRWPGERFAEVANYIWITYKYPIILIGGPNDEKALNECIEHLEESTKYVCPGPLSMGMLKAMLERAILLIGNDSGALHVAEGVYTPSIAVVGATDEREHLRESHLLHIVRKDHERNDLYQSYVGNEEKMDPVLAEKRMNAVTVETVLNVVKERLNT